MKIKKLITRLMTFHTIILGLVMLTIVVYSFFRNDMDNVRDSASSIGHCAADLLDGDKIYEYAMTETADEEYEKVKQQLVALKTNFAKCKYLYVIVPDGDEYVYVYDILTENDYANGEEDSCYLGFRDIFDEDHLGPAVRLYNTGGETKELDVKLFNQYGSLAAYFVPVYGSDGSIKAIVGIDHTIQDIVALIIGIVSLISILIILVIFAFAFFLVKKVSKEIVMPIETITQVVTDFANSEHNGQKDHNFLETKEGSENELDILSSDINKMMTEIDEYIINIENITKERLRIGTELDLANRIQASYLPRIFPPFPERDEFELFATMDPAKEVGGDFYDFFMIDDNHLGLVIADVSGKGIGAALYMMISKTLLNNQATFTDSPAAVLEIVNEKLCENNDAEMFVTVWLGILNLATGVITAANAGHEFPAIKRANGEFELFKDRHGFVLGGMQGIKYKEYEIALNSGDMIYVYTDGVAEATNAENVLYGTDRMISALNSVKDEPVEKILKTVRADIDSFVKDAPQFDDITMLGLKYLGKNSQ